MSLAWKTVEVLDYHSPLHCDLATTCMTCVPIDLWRRDRLVLPF